MMEGKQWGFDLTTRRFRLDARLCQQHFTPETRAVARRHHE
jgi:hypothetical protein